MGERSEGSEGMREAGGPGRRRTPLLPADPDLHPLLTAPHPASEDCDDIIERSKRVNNGPFDPFARRARRTTMGASERAYRRTQTGLSVGKQSAWNSTSGSSSTGCTAASRARPARTSVGSFASMASAQLSQTVINDIPVTLSASWWFHDRDLTTRQGCMT
jgi:hypothetical protein